LTDGSHRERQNQLVKRTDPAVAFSLAAFFVVFVFTALAIVLR
jgi:hypothetical protein